MMINILFHVSTHDEICTRNEINFDFIHKTLKNIFSIPNATSIEIDEL